MRSDPSGHLGARPEAELAQDVLDMHFNLSASAASDAQASVATLAASKRYRRVALMTSGGSTLRSENAA